MTRCRASLLVSSLRRVLPGIAACALLLLHLCTPATAKEAILSFDVTASVASDASITVQERIVVATEGKQIRRGIIRVFPVEHVTVEGKTLRVGFDLLSATLDDAPVPHRTERAGRSLEIRLGDSKSELAPGTYVYTLVYKTTDQISSFEEHDELFWNVTGNDWIFPIHSASFRVRLPGGAEKALLGSAAYTGGRGSREQAARLRSDGTIETTRTLLPGEGFSVAIAWPKGIVAPRALSLEERLARFATRQKAPLAAATVLLFLLVYGGGWILRGRDIPRETVIPLFTPPEGCSPGFVRFARDRTFSNEAFTAELLQMAIKGFLTLEALPEDRFVLRRRKGQPPKDPTSQEATLLALLFPGEAELLPLEAKSAAPLAKAHEALGKHFEHRGRSLFRENWSIRFGGLLLFLPVLWLFSWADSPLFSVRDGELLDLLILQCFAFLAGGSLLGFTATLKSAPRGKHLTSLFLAGACLFFFLLFARSLFAAFLKDPFLMGALLVSTALVFFFWRILPVRTHEGNRALQVAEGLALYLGTAETHRMEMLHPSEETPELFEALLPYAFALDCAETWVSRFDSILRNSRYEPAWAESKREDFPAGDPFLRGRTFTTLFTRTLSERVGATSDTARQKPSASSGASTSARPPSSRPSGLGDRGSSGGGGGGGGGRGW